MTSNEREAFLLEGFADRARELAYVEGRPSSDVDGASRFNQVRQVECRLECAVGICGRRRMAGSCGRGLAAGHRVNQIVDADDLQVDVAPRGVNQVIAADRR